MASSFAYGRKGGDPYSIDALKATVTASGIPNLKVVSTLRPGSITLSGSISNHNYGLAIDVAGPGAAMAQYANYMRSKYGSNLMELIYYGEGGPVAVHNGAPYTYGAAVQRQHHDHVHVAATVAGLQAAGGGSAVQATPVGNSAVDAAKSMFMLPIDTIRSLNSIADAVKWLASPAGVRRLAIAATGLVAIYIGASGMIIHSGSGIIKKGMDQI
jgi:hypothetical protein